MVSRSERPIHLDGTTLEGGGQLLRLSLCLSALTCQPIHITDIRGHRGTKPKDTGMKSAHLAGAQWLALATGAETRGLKLTSRELLFHPKPKDFVQTGLSKHSENSMAESGCVANGVWKNIYINDALVRRDTSIVMTTPGSIFLILQAVLPYILFSGMSAPLSVTQSQGSSGKAVPVRLTIEGGTNVWHSPSYEYVQQVLLPMLHAKLGIEPIQMTLHSRGWSSGHRSVGKVMFDITPLSPGASLPAFTFNDAGQMGKIHVSLFSPASVYRDPIKHTIEQQLSQQWPNAEIVLDVDEDSGHSQRLYLLLVAEFTMGHRIGHDGLFTERRDFQKPLSELTGSVISGLKEELTRNGLGCVDQFLQDQLVVFQALSVGKSIVGGGPPTLHTQTARWVAEEVVNVQFDEHGDCEGIAFRAG